MKNLLVGIVIGVLGWFVWGNFIAGDTGVSAKAVPSNGSLIPAPASMVNGSGGYVLSGAAAFNVPAGDAGAENAARYAADKIKSFTGLSLPVRVGEGTISLLRDASVAGDEAYTLRVAESGVEIRASSDAGLFYGAVSLAQLVGTAEGAEAIFLPAVAIADAPRFGWRGLMLDVARHFRSVDYVKAYIDRMAMLKMNSFHWHLTDDQGWRIEIKGYPKLTEVAAYRVNAGDAAKADIDPATGEPRLYGGFYTQDEIREVVAYAAARQITILPEIDVPAHIQSLITAYPELATKSSTGKVSADWGIFYETLNLEDETFRFMEGIYDQVIDLFPGKYVHIGGDEVQTKEWAESPRIAERMKELGIKDVHHIAPYFTNHFAKYLASKGRVMIGWDEILEGGLLDDSTVMSWRGTIGGIEAAKAGHDAIMSPHPIMYLDHLQSDSANEPTGRPLIQTLETVYNYEPIPLELNAAEAKHILGVQANVWAEHMRTDDRVSHMTFPRAAAVAEIGWSPLEKKDFAGFAERLPNYFAQSEAEGHYTAKSAYEVRVKAAPAAESVTVTLSNQIAGSEIRYTLDGSAPTLESSLYGAPLTLAKEGALKAAAFAGGRQMSDISTQGLTESALRWRSDDDLTLCSNNIPLRLDDDAPIEGERRVFKMDIMAPCWIYENANLDGVSTIEVSVGNVPFNFQIGADIEKVSFVAPTTEAGELVLFRDACDGTGAELARASLAPAIGNHEVTTLTLNLPEGTTSGNLCFRFAQHTYEPLWAIDWVQPVVR
jgi:hexosaminidase